MKSVDLSDLMGEMALRPGTWFRLLEQDTKFAPDRISHPYVFPDGWEPGGRRAFGHALPRSTAERWPEQRAGVDFLQHDPHGSHHGRRCELDEIGYIPPLRFPVARSWINRGNYICEEPSRVVLGRIQIFDMDHAK